MKRAWLSVLFGLLACAVSLASDFATVVAEATFHITNSAGGGTCFFVRREAPDSALYLVAAAHVLEAIEESPATVQLREQRPDGCYQHSDCTIALRREGKRLWLRHAAEDVAVLRLSEPPPVPVAALPYSALADEARFVSAGLHFCTSIFVLTYPTGFPAREGGFALARQGIIASHPVLPVQRYPSYAVSFTTFFGDSGGPVFVRGTRGRPLIIGVVVGLFNLERWTKTEFEERTVRYPYGAGLAVHAQLVRELIEQAAKQPATDSTKKPQSPNQATGAKAGGAGSVADSLIRHSGPPASLSSGVRP